MKMWIARNEDGTLALFKIKPMHFYEEGSAHYWAGLALYLPCNEYPEVTFENSPMEVEIVIKKNDEQVAEERAR